MFIITGLGNPGEKFNSTPHNFGFTVLDAFQGKNNFPDFKMAKKFDSEVSEEMLFGKKLILVKPQTFMNESGKAVKKILGKYKSLPFNLIIVHDDMDLPLGSIKIVKNRGSAGHKGVESIIKNLGSEDFIRIRLGISPDSKPKEPEKFVLKRFNERERVIANKTINKAVDIIEALIKDGLEKAMNEYNK